VAKANRGTSKYQSTNTTQRTTPFHQCFPHHFSSLLSSLLSISPTPISIFEKANHFLQGLSVMRQSDIQPSAVSNQQSEIK
jgi:hypothetical protein